MKKLALIACLLPAISFAQLRHVKGLNGTGMDMGVSQFGLVVGINYERFLSNKLYFQGNLFFETIKITPERIGVQSLGFEPGVNYTFFQKGNFYGNIFGGFSAILFEKADTHETAFLSEINQFRLGAFIGPQIEYYINSQFTLIGNFTEKIYFYHNEYGRRRWFATIGVRYNF